MVARRLEQFQPVMIVVVTLMLTTIFTWPFALNLGSYFYDRGDYSLSGSILSYNADSILNGRIFHQTDYFNGYQFYPQPYTMAFSDLRLTPTLIFLPIKMLTQNQILATNMTLFLSLGLSFLSAYYVLNYFTKNVLASLIGATVYAFNPLTFSRFPEHFELMNKYLLPLVFMWAHKLVTKPTFKDGVIFSLLFVLNAFTAIYFLLFSVLLLPLFGLPFILRRLASRDGIYFRKMTVAGLGVLVFIPVLVYFSLPYQVFADKEGSTRSLEMSSYFGARLIDFASNTTTSWLYGGLVKSFDPDRSPKDEAGNFNYLEHTLFPEIIPMLLMVVGLMYLVRLKKERLLLVAFGLVALLAFLLSFGAYFEGNEGVKMPFYLFYNVLPFLVGIRAPTRVLFLFYVPFCFFVAYGGTYLLAKLKQRWRLVVTAGLIAGIFVETYNPTQPLVAFSERSTIIPQVSSQLWQLGFLKGHATLHLPIYTPNVGLESVYLNWAALTKEKVMNGNSGYLPNDQIYLLLQLKDTLSRQAAVPLQLLGVDYVVVHKDLAGASIANLDFDPKSLVLANSNVMIYDLRRLAPAPAKCQFDRDISLEFHIISLHPSLDEDTNYILLTNKADCTLVSLYQDRYHQVDFIFDDGNGPNRQTATFRLPPLVGPHQQLKLDRMDANLKVN